MAIGCMLCSLAIVVLIFFCTWSGLSESTRGPLGFALAAVLVAIGVSLFIINHNRTKKWEWIEKEPFDTAYGVGGMAKQRRDAFQTSYTTNLVTSAVLLLPPSSFSPLRTYWLTAPRLMLEVSWPWASPWRVFPFFS